MSDVDIKAARAIIAAATPAPWRYCDAANGIVVRPDNQDVVNDRFARGNDLRLIAAARGGWPAALDALEQVTAERDAAVAALDAFRRRRGVATGHGP
jgi:hypothetical protein